jgi:hypothetical protein
MPAKKNTSPLTGPALLKETCRRIRLARVYWDAHNNRACRAERERALALYDTLTDAQREQIPQVLRVWLRYRSEKYFGPDPTREHPKNGPTSETQERRQRSDAQTAIHRAGHLYSSVPPASDPLTGRNASRSSLAPSPVPKPTPDFISSQRLRLPYALASAARQAQPTHSDPSPIHS